MAVRIRESGEIVCAAMQPELPGDLYIDDGWHYRLSAVWHVLVTDRAHLSHGLWWWAHAVPDGVTVDEWWK